MSRTTITPTLANVDGLAVIGRTLHDLRGIRFAEGEGGAAPAAPAAPAEPAAPVDPAAPAEPVTPVETDWKAEARKWEARAKDNSTAAARLAEIEESGKTEAQKVADRLAAAEKERDDLKAERDSLATEKQIAAWKTEVSKDTGVPVEILSGNTEEAIKAHAELLKPLIKTKPEPPRSPAFSRANNGDGIAPTTTPGLGTLRAGYAETSR